MKKIKRVFFLLLLVLLIIGIFGFVSLYFTNDKKNFYLSYNGKEISQSENELVLSIYETNKFEVKNILPFTNEKYSIKVLSKANKNNTFEYLSKGELYYYENGIDLTSAFKIDCKEKYFIIDLSEMLVEDILKKYYDDEELSIKQQDFIIDTTKNVYFKLVITSDSNTINIDVKTDKIPIIDLTLDKNEVVF